MPVTKTAKRALRSSHKKETANKSFMSEFEIALRQAQNTKSTKAIKKAISLTDRAAKKTLFMLIAPPASKNLSTNLSLNLRNLHPKKSKNKFFHTSSCDILK